MNLDLVVQALEKNPAFAGRSLSGWKNAQDLRAKKVAAVRRYITGDHPANMTQEMRNMLRVNSDDVFKELTNNYMGVVVETLSDRLEVTTIEDTTGDGSNAWATAVLEANQFDALQSIVHEAAVGDGDAYVLISYDAVKGVQMTHEPAFDGDEGMLVYYETRKDMSPVAAIKVWRIGADEVTPDVRINVYTAGLVARYISRAGGELEGIDLQTLATREGAPLGMPVVVFSNKSIWYEQGGRSEIEQAIPLQNALNRTLYSMVMAAELTAFQVRYAVGWQPPASMTPGMWIAISADQPLSPEENIQIGALATGDLAPYLDEARYLSGEIGRITRTPAPEFGNSENASGEALKQREIGLLGKARKAQTFFGAAWERCMTVAAAMQGVYGSTLPPAGARWKTRWRDIEIRNDTATVDNAIKVADRVGEREFLRLIAPVFGYDETKIDDMVQERAGDMTARLRMLDPVNLTF